MASKRRRTCSTCLDAPRKNQIRGAVHFAETQGLQYTKEDVARVFGVTIEQVQHMLASSSDGTHECRVRTSVDRETGAKQGCLERSTIPRSAIDVPVSGLLSLPPELIERIATFLPRTDLLRLRFTCKEMERATFNVFTEAYFTEPAYLLDYEDSMTVLREVSRHPIFGRSVRKIYISLAHFTEEWEEMDFPDEKRYPRATSEERNRTETYKCNFQKLARQREIFYDNGAFLYLKETLLNFMRLQNVPAIVITRGTGNSAQDAWGLERRSRLLGGAGFTITDGLDDYNMIGAVIRETGYPLAVFESRETAPCVPMWPFDAIKVPEAVVNTLTTLRLTLSPDDRTCGFDDH